MQFCDYCGREVDENTQRCPNCSRKLAGNNLKPKSRLSRDGADLSKVIIFLAMITTFFLSTYVPWNRGLPNGQIRGLGYSFLWQPPAIYASIDYGRVAISIIAVLSLTVCIYLLKEWFQRRREMQK